MTSISVLLREKVHAAVQDHLVCFSRTSVSCHKDKNNAGRRCARALSPTSPVQELAAQSHAAA